MFNLFNSAKDIQRKAYQERMTRLREEEERNEERTKYNDYFNRHRAEILRNENIDA